MNQETNYREEQDVVFIDAYNLIYRAFHGNQSKLTNADGLPTNAIYTITTMLFKLRKQFTNIVHAVAVFDGGGNFRKELDAEYKANRKPMPDELKVQMPYIKEVFEILGWPIIQAENVEADDVIATLAKRSAAKGFNTYIVSGDKDFRSIVTHNLNVVDTMQDICYDREKVFEKMGVYPENVVAYLSLLGDGVDNVIGIEQVGKKTAAKLLQTYGNLDGLIANKEELKGVAGTNIRAAIDSGLLAKNVELVTMKTDLEINITRKDVTLRNIDQERWNIFCEKMNFKTFANRPRP